MPGASFNEQAMMGAWLLERCSAPGLLFPSDNGGGLRCHKAPTRGGSRLSPASSPRIMSLRFLADG